MRGRWIARTVEILDTVNINCGKGEGGGGRNKNNITCGRLKFIHGKMWSTHDRLRRARGHRIAAAAGERARQRDVIFDRIIFK